MKRFGILLTFVVLSQDDHDSAVVKQVLPTAEGIEKQKFTVTADGKAKLTRAEGSAPSSDAVFYHSATAKLEFPEEGQFKTRTLVVKADGLKGPIRLAVAILPAEHMIIGIKILEHHEERDPTQSEFLEQFLGLSVTTDSLWRPRTDLKERRDRAARPGGDEDRILQALLSVKSIMGRVSELFPGANSKVRAGEAREIAELDSIRKEFEEFAGKVQLALFLEEGKRGKLLKMIGDARDRIQAVTDLVKAGKFSDAQEKFSEVAQKSCGACHGSFQGAFRGKREELGLGNGYLSVGFDLKAGADLDPKVQESIASAVRRAVMLLELAPQ